MQDLVALLRKGHAQTSFTNRQPYHFKRSSDLAKAAAPMDFKQRVR
jgi:hypothetical protein